jgi:hypothetical protein
VPPLDLFDFTPLHFTVQPSNSNSLHWPPNFLQLKKKRACSMMEHLKLEIISPEVKLCDTASHRPQEQT